MSNGETRRWLRRARLHAELVLLTAATPALAVYLRVMRPVRSLTQAFNRYMMRFRLWRCAFVIAAFGLLHLPRWVKRPWLVIPVVLVSQVVLIGPLDEMAGFLLLGLYVLGVLVLKPEERGPLMGRLRFAWSRDSSSLQIPDGVDAESMSA